MTVPHTTAPVRVVFLDVDGVLHSLAGDEMFNSACMDRLRRIVHSSNATIVLSSSWRQSIWGVEEVGYAAAGTDTLSICMTA